MILYYTITRHFCFYAIFGDCLVFYPGAFDNAEMKVVKLVRVSSIIQGLPRRSWRDHRFVNNGTCIVLEFMGLRKCLLLQFGERTQNNNMKSITNRFAYMGLLLEWNILYNNVFPITKELCQNTTKAKLKKNCTRVTFTFVIF